MPEARITISAEDLASAVIESVRKSQQGLRTDVETTNKVVGGSKSSWDSMVTGMNQSGKAATDSGKMISAMSEAGKKAAVDTSTAGHSLSGIADHIKEAFENPLGAVKSLALEVGEGLVGSISAGAAAAAGMVGVLAGLAYASVELTEKWAAQGAAIQDASEKTSLTAERFSDLAAGARLAGTDMGKMSNILFMMQARMENSPDEMEKGLKQIGLSIADIERMEPDEQILAIAAGFKDASEQTNKQAVAMDIFGRQGRDILPLMHKDLNKLVDVSERLGSTWSTEDAEAAEEFEIGMNELHQSWENFTRHLEEKFLPIGKLVVDTVFHIMNPTYGTWFESSEHIQHDLDKMKEKADRAVNGFHEMGDGLKEADAAAEKLANRLQAAANSKAVKDMFSETAGGAKQLELSEAELKIEEDRLTESVKAKVKAEEEAEKAAKKVRDSQIEVRESTKSYTERLANLTATQKEQIEVALRHKVSVEDIARAYHVAKTDVEAVGLAIKDTDNILLDAFKRGKERGKDFGDQLAKDMKHANEVRAASQADNFDAYSESLKNISDLENAQRLSSWELEQVQIQNSGDARKMALDKHVAHYGDALVAIDRETELRMSEAVRIHNQKIDEMKASEASWSHSMQSIVAGLPSLITQGFLGGGGAKGITNAIASQLGGAATTGLFNAAAGSTGLTIGGTIANKVGSVLGKGVGTALNAVLPGIGSLAGPLISKGIGAIAGLFTKGSQLNDERDSWVMQFTGIKDLPKAQDALRKLATEAGATDAQVRALFDAKKVDGFHNAQKTILDLLDKQKQKTADLASLLDAEGQKRQMLQAAVERYGFTLDELGPTMQRQKLGEQAEQILEDFDLLTESGMNSNTVIEKMTKSINEFILNAIRTGTEVPEKMRPMLEQMMQAGELTDANGQKITDFKQAGIIFGETLTETFKNVALKLTELIDTLKNATTGVGNLSGAAKGAGENLGWMALKANEIPHSIETDVTTYHHDEYDNSGGADYAAEGGIVRPRYFGAGGRVPGGPRGTDTVPAWLTPGEGVLSRRGMAALDKLNKGSVDSSSALLEKFSRLGDQTQQLLEALPLMLRHATRATR